MIDQLRANLNTLMAAENINAAELAQKTGVGFGTINRLKSKGGKNPTLDTILPICQHFGVSIAQILGEDVLPLSSQSTSSLNRPSHNIPLIQWNEVPVFHTHKDWADFICGSQDASYCLKIANDNWGWFIAGLTLYVSVEGTPQNNDYIIAYDNDTEEVIFKRLIIEAGVNYVQSLISGIEIQKLPEKYTISGKVIIAQRDF